MLIPAAPTFLLAAGGIVLILSRWIQKPNWHQAVWLIAVIGAVWQLVNAGCHSSDPVHSVRFSAWANDPLAIAGQSLALMFGVLFGFGTFGLPDLRQPVAERFGFLAFQTAGMMLAAAANDSISLALSIEIVQFSAFALRALDRLERNLHDDDPRPDSTNNDESLWLGIVTSSCLWLGIALLANVTASTQFDEIRKVMTDAYSPDASRAAIGAGSKLGLLGIGLILAGLGSRVGIVPWHVAFVATGRNTSYWTAGCILIGGQFAGLIALSRLCGTVWVGYREELLVLLLVLAGLTFLVSGTISVFGLAPGEGRIVRWLMSIPMLHGAWMIVGLMATVAELAVPEHRFAASGGQPGGLAIFLFAEAAGLLGLSGLFLLMSYLSRTDREVEFVDELLGLGELAPLPATGLLVVLASLIGQPPSWGFWSNWLLTVAGFNIRALGGRDTITPHLGMFVLLIAALVGTLLTTAVVLRFASVMIFDAPLARTIPQGRRASLVMGCVCALLLIAVGLCPNPLLAVLSHVKSPGNHSTPDEAPGSSRGEATALLLQE